MQEALHKYQAKIKRTNGTGVAGETPRTTSFNVPVIPSPLTSRHYNDEDSASVEGVFLSVDSKKNIKLSSDSGLGSVELVEESNSWKNGKRNLDVT